MDVLETAASLNAPVIIQFSNGGAQFNAGKGLSAMKGQQAAILGAVPEQNTFTTLARPMVPLVILHTDMCAKNYYQWIDDLLDASEKHFKETENRYNSSHMIDLSGGTDEENIEIL